MFSKVLIVCNPSAGKGESPRYGELLAKQLKEHYRAVCHIKISQSGEDIYRECMTASNRGYDTVICLGGDGTLTLAANGLMQNSERPIFGFIPLGTANDLARALKLSLNPNQLIEQYSNVRTQFIDVGRINDEYFINVVALGALPDTVMNTSSEDKERMGFMAYVREGVQTFFDQDGMTLRIQSTEGELNQLTTNLVIVGLTNSVGSFQQMIPHAKVDDGLIHLIAVKGDTTLDTIRAAVDYKRDTTDQSHYLTLSSQKITIEQVDGMERFVNVDGNSGPVLPVELEALPSALQVIVPQGE